MCPDSKISAINTPQRGFAIVAAIFLLVVLASLGAFMLTFSTVQHMTSAQDLQGAKAYQAARTGIEWGAYKALQGSCAASTVVPVGGGLSGFSLTVQCATYGPYTEGGSSVTLYQITATATQGTVGAATYVERQLKATVGK
ncbi:hypothetical protein [Sulfurirhabdus autotrophica]|uniref:MSHA biogenesis protein MshP n=1 Tax=Sulfurirhabdus autotrophica TaxID=1706046 RepID=A0A4R3Y157_9PROT|nr:hypothetical protein [Sulfurirhabdus autotrophica]TCV85217.1 MSHA biogenesis protein MshP [Sulfurirhabdus autotrophica]